MILPETRHFETVCVLYFFKEKEGTSEEIFESLKRTITPRERNQMRQAIWRLQCKGIIERIGYSGHFMNYRITETALARGLTKRRRGIYGIKDHSDGRGQEPSGAGSESASVRG